ncbi:MAG: SH3 domain-containing protein [Opitutae bacterium]|nr:SH3 domain-containing protein [Opitutae bacterium]
MRTKLLLLLPVLRRLGVAGALALAAARLAADPLASDTAVFLQADPKSPVIARLKAGATVTTAGEAPAGWRRVEVSGPFEAYVHNRDITKGLDVREGANILASPDKTSRVLTVAQKGDKTEITGLHGDWSQIKLEKTLQGFIATGSTANTGAEPALARPAAPAAPAPAAPAASSSAPGRPVAITGDTADMPRNFQGTLVVAKRAFLNPNPPYDYQLTDSNGRRFAYVDTRRLLLTDKLENFVGLVVNLTGTVRNTVDGKDLVIDAESLQTR